MKLRPDMSVLNFNLAQALEALQAQKQRRQRQSKRMAPGVGNGDDDNQSDDDEESAKLAEELHLRALELNPQATDSMCALVLGRLYTLDWRDRETFLNRIKASPAKSCGNAFYEAATSADIQDLTFVARFVCVLSVFVHLLLCMCVSVSRVYIDFDGEQCVFALDTNTKGLSTFQPTHALIAFPFLSFRPLTDLKLKRQEQKPAACKVSSVGQDALPTLRPKV